MANTSTDILSALQIDDLLPEEQEQLLTDLDELIFKATLIELLEHMDEETQDAFNRLLDTDASEEEIDTFLKEHVPNSEQITEDVIREMTSDILSLA